MQDIVLGHVSGIGRVDDRGNPEAGAEALDQLLADLVDRGTAVSEAMGCADSTAGGITERRSDGKARVLDDRLWGRRSRSSTRFGSMGMGRPPLK